MSGQSQQIFLSEHLKNAHVEVLPLMPQASEIIEMIASGRLDGFATNRASLEEVAALSPKVRVLADNFLSVGQAIVVAKGNRAGIDFLNWFVDDVLGSGFVKDTLDRAKIAGTEVAPRRR